MPVVRDISIILLVAVAMLLATLPLALAGALVYGLGRLMQHRNLPTWLGLANAYVRVGQAYVELGMAHLSRPVLAISSGCAWIRSWARELGSTLGRKDG